jgi:hypothetical protein
MTPSRKPVFRGVVPLPSTSTPLSLCTLVESLQIEIECMRTHVAETSPDFDKALKFLNEGLEEVQYAFGYTAPELHSYWYV